jgi:hypothetical protein
MLTRAAFRGRPFSFAESPHDRVTALRVTKGHLPSVLRRIRLKRYSKDKFAPRILVVLPTCGKESLNVRGMQWRQRA